METVTIMSYTTFERYSNIICHDTANYVIIIKARSLLASIEISIERRWECIDVFDAVRGFDHTLNLQGNHGNCYVHREMLVYVIR